MPIPPLTPPEPMRRGLKRTAARAGVVAYAALRLVRFSRALIRGALSFVLALVIAFEEWGWRPLAAMAARLARFRSIAALEAFVQALPPYPSLLVFVLPSVLLFPLKLVALWLIATGHVILAGLVFTGAKVVGTALLARIFQLTQPKLMQLAWFAALYGRVVPWKDALVARAKATPVWQAARAMKARVKARAEPIWQALKPRVTALAARLFGARR